jgi:signal transduction histidine kinase
MQTRFWSVFMIIEAVDLSICISIRGITEEEKSDLRSLGLLGMRERAHLIGADNCITGAEGRGTEVTVRVPILPSENNAIPNR